MANLGHPHQHGEPAPAPDQAPDGDEPVGAASTTPQEPGLFAGQDRPTPAAAVPARRQQQRRRR